MAVTSGLKRAASEEPERHEAVQQPMDMKRVKVPNATEPVTATGKNSTTELEGKGTEVAQEEQKEVAAQLEIAGVSTTTKMNPGSSDDQLEEISKAPGTEVGVPVGEQTVIDKIQTSNGGDMAASEVHVEGTPVTDAIGAETAQPITDPVVISDDDSEEYSENEEEDESSEDEYDHEPYGTGPVRDADQSGAWIPAFDPELEVALDVHEDMAMAAMTTEDVYAEMGIASDSDDSEGEANRKREERDRIENDDGDWGIDGDYDSDF